METGSGGAGLRGAGRRCLLPAGSKQVPAKLGLAVPVPGRRGMVAPPDDVGAEDGNPDGGGNGEEDN